MVHVIAVMCNASITQNKFPAGHKCAATPEETNIGPIGPQFIPPNIEPQLRF